MAQSIVESIQNDLKCGTDKYEMTNKIYRTIEYYLSR
jgi:hypothetical protein